MKQMQSFFNFYMKITFFLLTTEYGVLCTVSYSLPKRKKKTFRLIPTELPCRPCYFHVSSCRPHSPRVGVRPSRDKCVLSSHCCQHGPRSGTYCCDDEFAQHLPEITLLVLFLRPVWERSMYPVEKDIVT